MKRRRRLELLLGDIRSLLADPVRAENDYALTLAVLDVASFTEELSWDAAKTRAVLEVAAMLRIADCAGRQVAEGRLMDHLEYLATQCASRLQRAGLAHLSDFGLIAQAPLKLQPTCEVLGELRTFALGCFEFKRPRDSFGGRRRAMAFEILGQISRSFDLPEVVCLARQSLRKTRSVESRQAADFLREYLAQRGLSPDDDMTNELLSLAQRTHSRSIAFNALNALVETGTISELQALDRMDAWKRKHRW